MFQEANFHRAHKMPIRRLRTFVVKLPGKKIVLDQKYNLKKKQARNSLTCHVWDQRETDLLHSSHFCSPDCKKSKQQYANPDMTSVCMRRSRSHRQRCVCTRSWRFCRFTMRTLTLQPPPTDQTPGCTSLLQQTGMPKQTKTNDSKSTDWWSFRVFPTFLWSRWTWASRTAAVCRRMQQQNAPPQTSFPLSRLLFTLFFFPPDHMTASPFCPWPYEHFFSLFMNIFMCLPGRSACAARGVGLFARDVFTGCGKSRPLEHPAPGRVLQGQSCPQAQSNHQQSKSDTPARVGWKVTGRDILPSGHSQLTAINDTTHGGWRGKDLIESFLCFRSLRVLFLPQTIFFVCDHCQEPKAEFKKKTRLKLNTSFASILSRNYTAHS